MGRVIKKNSEVYFQQEDGEITARLTDFTEKMELTHKESNLHKRILHIFVALGALYLTVVFLYH